MRKRILILYLKSCYKESLNSLLSYFTSFERITIITGCSTSLLESDCNHEPTLANSFWETNDNEIKEKIEQSDCIVLPDLYDELLKNIADGDVTQETEEWIMYALCLGKKVITFDLLPEERSNSCLAVKRYYAKKRQRLQDCGIDSVIMSKFKETMEEDANDKNLWNLKKLITNEDILELHKTHKDEIHLSDGIRMTPLAIDTAKELHMKITTTKESNA